jgi:pimeloyl-ACP methyl ester carboxylesterase
MIPLFLFIFFGVVFVTPGLALSGGQAQLKSVVSDISPTIEMKPEIVVLIHGLMRTSLSMRPLKTYLEKQNFQVYSYSYPSAKYNIHDHALYLKTFVINLLIENPGVKIHFITHSLGGIITREALSRLTKEQLKKIGYLIMLAPPNQGSSLAKLTVKMFPVVGYAIKPLSELSSDPTSYVHRVPIPDVKMAIIAAKYDAKVPPSSAFLKGQADPFVINSNHMFIINSSSTRKLILQFLKKDLVEGG